MSEAEVEPPAFTRAQLLYVWLAAFFSACLILADIIGIKLFQLGPVVHTCGMLTFPLTFLITDLVNEYYGKQAARRMTYIAFAMGSFAFAVIFAALRMPYLEAVYNVSPDAFERVFKASQRMYVASLVAYLIGQLFDVWIFGVMKRLTGGKRLWLRAAGSTVVSQMLDSLIVTTLAFGGGQMSAGDLLKMAATGYVLKFCLAVAVTPLMYAGREGMSRWFGLAPLPPD
jgi:queuosine precursor transporter